MAKSTTEAEYVALKQPKKQFGFEENCVILVVKLMVIH